VRVERHCSWLEVARRWVGRAPFHLLLISQFAALTGYFGPWVAHETAALTLTGQDLAEFVKFLPSVRSGELQVARQIFYLPPLIVALTLLLMAANARLPYRGGLRIMMLLLSVPVTFSMLPPAWTPSSLVMPEFRLQTVAIAVCLGLWACFPILRRLSPVPLEGGMAALMLLGAVWPLWQFLEALWAINAVYGRSVELGWGLWTTPAAFALGLAALLTTWVSRGLRS